MTISPKEIARYNEVFMKELFKNKERFHQRQARLPIEEKIKILVELQKIALTIRPQKGKDDKRIVWRIS